MPMPQETLLFISQESTCLLSIVFVWGVLDHNEVITADLGEHLVHCSHPPPCHIENVQAHARACTHTDCCCKKEPEDSQILSPLHDLFREFLFLDLGQPASQLLVADLGRFHLSYNYKLSI